LPRKEYVEAVKTLSSNIAYVLGIRSGYRVEIILSLLAVVAFISGWRLWGLYALPTEVITGIILAGPGLLQVSMYLYRRKKITDEKLRQKIPRPEVPLIVVIIGAVMSGFCFPLIVPTVLNAVLIENITTMFAGFEVVQVKRSIRILLAPVTKKEMFTLMLGSTLPAILAFYVTHSLIVLAYPVISYALLAYSLILVPPSYRKETTIRRSLLEEISRRIPLLYFIFMKFYQNRKRVKLGKEAGYIGASYYIFLRKAAGFFTLSFYVSLAITPLLYMIIGRLAFILPLPVALLTFYMPTFVFKMKRSSRAGKISRNLMLILTYFASMASVAEDFTNMMLNLKYTPALARMFGLEDECNYYLNIYNIRQSTEVAMQDYADTVPEDYYRDTIRGMKDILENEGFGAVFRMLIRRLRDYTARHIDRVASTFENIGSNLISIIILLETTMPILLFISRPTMAPMLMLMTGVVSSMLMGFVSATVLPDLPSEFVHQKQRMKVGSLVFAITASFLTLLGYILLPDLLGYIVVLSLPVSLMTAIWYASAYDLTLNEQYLAKFPDLLLLFTSNMIRYNSVEKALLDLSQMATFPPEMAQSFQRLANIYAFLTAEKLVYRGPFWYKYFMFLSSIAGKYGTTPRELYKAIGDFMLEYKKFFDAVKTFGYSLIMMTLLALVILNIEVVISIGFLNVFGHMNTNAVAQMGYKMMFPHLSTEQIESVKSQSYTVMLLIALMNGIALGKAIDGTFRSGKYTLFMFLVQMILLYIGIKTGFGIHLTPATH